MKVLEPPARCLAPNGSRGRHIPIHEAVRTGKFRKGGAKRLTHEGAVVSAELRDITNRFIGDGKAVKGMSPSATLMLTIMKA